MILQQFSPLHKITRPARKVSVRYRNLDEILMDLEEGMLVGISVPGALMDFVDESNVDKVVAGLPARYRAFALEWAHGVVFSPKHELIRLSGGANLSDIPPEDRTHPREEATLNAFRAWFDRHPWPAS